MGGSVWPTGDRAKKSMDELHGQIDELKADMKAEKARLQKENKRLQDITVRFARSRTMRRLIDCGPRWLSSSMSWKPKGKGQDWASLPFPRARRDSSR